MGRRITLYETALAEAEATGGVIARQAAIAAFAKADSIFRLIHRIRAYIVSAFAFIGLLVIAAIFVDWGFNGFTRHYWETELPNMALVRTAIYAGLAFAFYSVWDIVLLFEKLGFVPGRLKSQAMAPFNAVRERCANTATSAFEHDGKLIDGPIFKSFWSLILFSQFPAHRRFRLPDANGIIEVQPLIDALVSGEVVVFEPGDEPVHEAPTFNATINYTQTTNNLTVQNTIQVAPEAKRRKKPETPHWYASVSFDMHTGRSAKIANHWNGIETLQVQTALDTAFAQTREDGNPNISRGDLGTSKNLWQMAA